MLRHYGVDPRFRGTAPEGIAIASRTAQKSIDCDSKITTLYWLHSSRQSVDSYTQDLRGSLSMWVSMRIPGHRDRDFRMNVTVLS